MLVEVFAGAATAAALASRLQSAAPHDPCVAHLLLQHKAAETQTPRFALDCGWRTQHSSLAPLAPGVTLVHAVSKGVTLSPKRARPRAEPLVMKAGRRPKLTPSAARPTNRATRRAPTEGEAPKGMSSTLASAVYYGVYVLFFGKMVLVLLERAVG